MVIVSQDSRDYEEFVKGFRLANKQTVSVKTSSIKAWKNACNEIWLDSLPHQHIGRYAGKKPSYVIVDDYCSSGKSPEIDPQELRNVVGRTLRGETPDLSPFKARTRSERQLKGYHKRLIKRNGILAQERDEALERNKKLQEQNAEISAQRDSFFQHSQELEGKIADLKTIIEQLEDKKLPEKGSW